jgi:phosphohistidine phosphatase SixA
MAPRTLAAALLLLVVAVPARTQTLSGRALVTALRSGGYVILMRHAHAPLTLPTSQSADHDNVDRERQLDEAGRASATAMGQALRALNIPVGDVVTSPTYRARETARLAGWTHATTAAEIGDNGRGMQQVVPEAQAEWLRQRVARQPRTGTDTIIVTHQPNIARAFPDAAAGLSDGEALIFRPDGKGGASLLARVKIDQWPQLPR